MPFVASPVYYDGFLYTIKDGGILASTDDRTGKLVKAKRLKASGNYYSSPIAADGKLFLIDQRGRSTVVSAGRDWRVLSTGDFDEDVMATPAIVDGCIYVRTQKHLYCFRQER